MEENFLELTPKRRSILWKYKDDGTAFVIAVKNEKLEQLQGIFKNERPKTDVKTDDGYGIAFNETGTKIWEQCDGVTTVREIIDVLYKTYGGDIEEITKDLDEFMDYCEKMDILERKWRSIL